MKQEGTTFQNILYAFLTELIDVFGLIKNICKTLLKMHVVNNYMH
jgi:hypothetical protein